MRPLKVGVVGCGARAMSHMGVLLKLSDKFEVAAVCDVDEARAAAASAKTGAKPYTDVLKMLSREKLDACLIAVQAEGHHVVAKALAERGVHILTETPIAITLPCADQMIEAAEDHGVLLEVSENVPRWLHERVKQEIVTMGLLGEVREFYLSYTSGSYHGVAAIRSILKTEAESVVGEFPPKDSVLERADIRLLSGVKGVYEFNRGRGNYWEIVGTKGALRGKVLHLFECDQKFEIRIVQEDSKIRGAKVDTSPEIYVENHLQEYPLESVDEIAIADAWLSLYNAIEHSRPLSYGAKNARKDLELIIAVRDSALRGGLKIQLPLKEITIYEKLLHEEFAKVYGLDPLLLNPEHLKVKYALPGKLRSLMYCGRTDADIAI
ncbi:MAG: Gfo/Idh/MocA family oxidoreductase [Thermofilum sp.]|nr:Gfo/Idh/MocA family oxidoreductase [Thermofilum sp.]